MAGNWMEQYEVAPTGQGGAPEAWTERYSVAPTAVPARRAAPYEAEGAPYAVRATVGSARDPDKLATLKRYYPDAEQTDDGNFVFTDTTSRKRTLYNPKGLDVGDFASLVRQYAETIGGVVGGGAGFVAGGVPGAIVGAGAGTGVAGKAVDVGRNLAGLPQTHSATDTAKDIAYGAAGEAGGRAIPEAGRQVGRWAMREGAPAVAEAAKRLGIDPTGSMTMRRIPAAVEHTARNVLPGSRPERTTEALYKRADEMLKAAQPKTPGDPGTVKEAIGHAGAVLKSGADEAYTRFKTERLALDNEFYSKLPEGVRFRLPRVKQYANDIRTKIMRDPGSAAELQPVLDEIAKIDAGLAAHNGAAPIDIVRQRRTALGSLLDTEATTKLIEPVQRELRNLYGALGGDLKATAAVIKPEAAAALDRHDRLVRAFRGSDLGYEAQADSLAAIMKSKSDEAAWSALHSTTGGQERMKRLVEGMKPEERRIVARATWDRMMKTPKGNEVEPADAWATDWKNLPKAQKQLLFGGETNIAALDDLAEIMRAQTKGAAGSNVSGTSYDTQRAGAVWNIVKTLLGGATGAAGMADLGTTVGTAAGVYGLAELFYHPAVIRRAIDAVNATGRAAGPVPRAVGQTLTPLARAGVTGPPLAIPPPERRDMLGGP